jgi:hypothetical protein
VQAFRVVFLVQAFRVVFLVQAFRVVFLRLAPLRRALKTAKKRFFLLKK